MQPFNRSERFSCPKCGWGVSKRVYCEGRVTKKRKKDDPMAWESIYSCSHEVEGEHMHLVCADCGHTQMRKVIQR